MPNDWTVLTGPDLRKVLSIDVLLRANQNTGAEVGKDDPLDEEAPNRAGDLVAEAVAEVRGAIRSGGRFPLSVTAGAVPPSGVRHTLYLAAWRLVLSTPNVPMVVFEERAALEKPYADAAAWVKALAAGGTVESPPDPTGRDYETAVSDSNPAVCAVRWADDQADDADYAAGYRTTSDGVRVDLPNNEMSTS